VDNAQPGDITLVGVADPLAQAGEAEATSAAARLTAQGIEPAPKPGFAGAAVVDSQGRVAGMMDLKATAVAGGAASPSATLVPIDSIRAFLQAQHVALSTAGTAPAAQSVMRVICVRK